MLLIDSMPEWESISTQGRRTGYIFQGNLFRSGSFRTGLLTGCPVGSLEKD